MLRGHGGDAHMYTEPVICDFSTNVYHGGASDKLKYYLTENIDSVEIYPEPEGESLCRVIADHLSLDPENVSVTNGTAEAVYLIASLFVSCSTLIPVPTFAEYEDACRLYKQRISYVKYPEIKTCEKFLYDLVFICNPNNPDGDFIESDYIESMLGNNPKTYFVVDEAYIDFTEKVSSCAPLLGKHSNLIILRSMTKKYALPGLRLGYTIAHSSVIEKMRTKRYPWSVNGLALKAGEFCFREYSDFKLPLKEMLMRSDILFSDISLIEGFKPQKSCTNYFLIKLEHGYSDQLKDYLKKEHGLLIRECSNFRSLDKSYIRIASKTPDMNRLLTGALKEWKKK